MHMKNDDISFVTELIENDEIEAPEHETAVPNVVE